MKIWYDALTGKHVRYGVAIARHLRNKGHQVTLTTRRHPDTVPMMEYLKEEFTVVGRYNPTSLLTRLQEGTKRQLFFCKLFGDNCPNVAISHGSADLCRVAFGLGIPIITTVDTPYADAVNRLTIPLSNYVVTSKGIPHRIVRFYDVDAKIVNFNGVDEAAWIKGFTPPVQYDFGRPLIVVRDVERKAVYSQSRTGLVTLAKALTKLGKVVFLSRYARKESKNLIIPEKFVDSASLVANADLFVGVGGTITREAALQGTPAITIKIFPDQHVNNYLARKGFPIFRTEQANVCKLAEKLVGRRYDIKDILDGLENPIDVISDIVSRISQNQ